MAAAQYYEEVQQAYLAYYGRPADPAGQAYWANQLNNAGGNLSSIINAFGTSAESTALYGGSNTAAQISAIYETLFGRQPDTAGLNFYVNGIATGQFTLASVALNVYYGATGTDATALTAKLAYADAFTTALEASTSAQVAYTGTAASNNARAAVLAVVDTTSEATAAANLSTTLSSIGAGAVGQTVTLTTSVDNVTLTGNNNVVNGIVGTSATTPATFTPADSITAAANSTGNVLNITDATGGSDAPAPVTVSGVQTLNWVSAGWVGTNGLDVSGYKGLTQLNVTEVGGDNTITAAATTNVTVTDANLVGTAAEQASTPTNPGTINVEGGQNVSITASGVTATGTITVNGATGAVAVTENVSKGVNAANANGVTITGGTTVTVTENLGKGATGNDVTVTGATTTTSVTVNQSTTTGSYGSVTIVDAANVNALGVAQTTSTTLGSITSVSLSNANGTNGAVIDDNALSTLTLAGTNNVTLNDGGLTAQTGAVTSLTLNANAATANVVDTGTVYTTLNVVTGGSAASTLDFVDSNLAKVNVSGTQHIDLSALAVDAAAVTAINVSGGAGVTAVLNAGESFISTSTGHDVVTIGAAVAKGVTVTGNGTAGEEIVWNGGAIAPAADGSESLAATGGSVSGFTTLGVVGAAAGAETFDLSQLTGFKALDVQGSAGAAITFENVAAGTSLAITSGVTGGVTYTTADTTGTSDTLNLTLGSAASTSSVAVDSLTLADSLGIGLGTLNIDAVNAASSAAAPVSHSIALTDANLAALNVSGTASLDITGGLTVTGNALVIDATAATNSTATTPTAATLTIDTLTDNSAKFALTVNGSEHVAITSLSSTGTGSLTITANDSAGVDIDTGAPATLTQATLSFTNSSTATHGALTIGGTAGTASNLVTDAAATSLALNGNVAIDFASGDNHLNAKALTVSGSTDNANVKIDLSLSSLNNTVTLGGGYDAVKLGTGADTVTFGAHTPVTTAAGVTAGDYDMVTWNASSTGLNSAAPNQPSVLTTGMATVTGLVSGDVINIGVLAATAPTALATNLAGVTAHIAEAHGTFSGGTFTYNANGNDTLLTVDTTGASHYESIVLVGYHGAVGTLAAGHFTLA